VRVHAVDHDDVDRYLSSLLPRRGRPPSPAPAASRGEKREKWTPPRVDPDVERRPLPLPRPLGMEKRSQPEPGRWSGRRPRNYWMDMRNVERELVEFWDAVGVAADDYATGGGSKRPSIPSEALLNYFGRHDLRGAITAHGGRDSLSERLGSLPIVPGRWADAVRWSPEVRRLLETHGVQAGGELSPDVPPSNGYHRKYADKEKPLLPGGEGPYWRARVAGKAAGFVGVEAAPGADGRAKLEEQEGTDSEEARDRLRGGEVEKGDAGITTEIEADRSATNGTNILLEDVAPQRWQHVNTRKKYGYWNDFTLRSEIYEFITRYMEFSGRPAIWMPRLADFDAHGRSDIQNAINRFGGANVLCKKYCLVPFQEWQYFESLYQLCVGLKAFQKTYGGDNPNVFPPLADIKDCGLVDLYYLIQRNGGKKIIAKRFDLLLPADDPGPKRQTDATEMKWGPFSLDFALELMEHVRGKMLDIRPGDPAALLQTPGKIWMPSEQELLQEGERGKRMAGLVRKYGGYESVARRVGLTHSSRP